MAPFLVELSAYLQQASNISNNVGLNICVVVAHDELCNSTRSDPIMFKEIPIEHFACFLSTSISE
jgi:hypothetical protein